MKPELKLIFHRSWRRATLVVVAVVTAAAFWATFPWPRVPALITTEARKTVVAGAPAPRSLPSNKLRETTTPPATMLPTRASKSDEFDQLVKTGVPQDAFAAYRMLLKCTQNSTTECGDLTGGQKTMAYNLLKQAVAAHVPNSSVYLLITTPDGRLPHEVQGDPAYATWDAEARREIADAAARGDTAALGQMAELCAHHGKPDKALAYWTAYMDKAPPAYKQINELLAARYADGLTPAQARAAIAEGHQIGTMEK